MNAPSSFAIVRFTKALLAPCPVEPRCASGARAFLHGAASAAVASDEWPGLPCATSKDGMAVQRLVIRADWTIVHMNGRQVPVEGLLIVVEDGRIADLTREPPTEGETIAIPGGIAFPGFINL